MFIPYSIEYLPVDSRALLLRPSSESTSLLLSLLSLLLQLEQWSKLAHKLGSRPFQSILLLLQNDRKSLVLFVKLVPLYLEAFDVIVRDPVFVFGVFGVFDLLRLQDQMRSTDLAGPRTVLAACENAADLAQNSQAMLRVFSGLSTGVLEDRFNGTTCEGLRERVLMPLKSCRASSPFDSVPTSTGASVGGLLALGTH